MLGINALSLLLEKPIVNTWEKKKSVLFFFCLFLSSCVSCLLKETYQKLFTVLLEM